ncbi:insulinase family protein [Campylobacter sp. RM12640]|uniref:M16 family metallopeptidase n=1 Tax=unclassified Campylobacter TaxID=2593542 RepID=UPI001BDB431C|nr:insulinase family protein [Campylobacter sp. 2018MI13]MBZ7976960.1 insulinase family protein [Campylobacter sp. RM12637]MBZ7978731.1 insulinase family protein [Campylobacter sp. RM12654]MBZ7982019.1 insulinase family protein [Campylobacter sp. RM12640]MBZ7989847.1 insulinase family protein [Campylobacter sp. RM12635]MBZ7993307.1 insulinase family protein [Campylobacter sp. RM9333]
MNNFVHLKTNDDLVYISISYPNYGRIFHNANAMAAEFFYNESLDDEFYIKLEQSAINISASANYFDFTFDIVCLKKELDNCLNAFNNMLLNTEITNFELIKNKIKNYFLIHIQDYDNLAKMKLYENYFKNDFKNDKFGDFEALDEKEFKNYILNLKNQANKIVISANLDDISKVKKLLNNKQSSYEKLKTNESFYKEESKEISQAFVRFISSVEIKSIYERAIISLAIYVLGGGFGSRITEEIRVKRGLAYSAFAFLVAFKKNYLISGYLQTKNESKKEAIKIVQEEFKKLVEFGISEDEFKKAKDFLVGSEILKYSTTQNRHSIASSECFSDLKQGELREITKIIKDLELKTCNDFLKNQKSITELSFYVIGNNE